MNLSQEEEENSLSLSKFESMLKTNKVFFFDSEVKPTNSITLSTFDF